MHYLNMWDMPRYVYYVAFVLVSHFLSRPAEALSSKDRDRVILTYTTASDRCKGITSDTHPSSKEAADTACDAAFKALDDIGKNSCHGWRKPECRQLRGYKYSQCSCKINWCNRFGIKLDDTKTFRDCASEIWTDEVFDGEAQPSAKFRELWKLSDDSLETSGSLPALFNFWGPSKAAGPSTSSARSSPKSAVGAEDMEENIAEAYCTICKRGYSTRPNLLKHYRRRHPETYIAKRHNYRKIPLHVSEDTYCRDCNQYFSTRGNLTRHARLQHPGTEAATSASWTGVKNYSCYLCGESFRWMKALVEHQKTHPEDFECHLCDVNLGTKENLERHMNIRHREDMAEPSDEPGPSVGSKRKYSVDFYCHICQEKRASRFNLNRHIKNSHPGFELAALGRDPNYKP